MVEKKPRLHVQEIDGVTVGRFLDSRILDEAAVHDCKEQMSELALQEGRASVVLNFANVEFLTSAMLGSLLMLNGRLTAAGGKLMLCNIRPGIREIFQIVQLTKVIEIKDSESDALAAIKAWRQHG